MPAHIQTASTENDFDFIAQHFEETIALWEHYQVTPESIARQKQQLQAWGTRDNAYLSVATLPKHGRVGFNSLYISKNYDGSLYGKIVILYVLPEFRGQGIAATLKQTGEAWLRLQGVKRIVTEIDAQNQRMLEINQKTGFRVKSYLLEKDLE